MDLKVKKLKYLELLPLKNYSISKVCKAMSMSRQTYYNWTTNDSDFKQAIEDLNEADIDDSEESLRVLRRGVPELDANGKFVKWTHRPDVTALIFHLKTKGAARGYIERSYVESKQSIQLDR